MIVYADTSLVAKLIKAEPETAAVRAWLKQDGVRFVSGRLLETEVRRVAARFEVPQDDATKALDAFELYDVPQEAFRGAGVFPEAGLRSLDAIHLTVATMIGVRAIATYDERMQAAANRIGLPVLLPDVSASSA